MLVKLRPFVTMFLKAASHMFEMYINTKGPFGLLGKWEEVEGNIVELAENRLI